MQVSVESPVVIASLVKHWFRELSAPLIPTDRLLECTRFGGDSSKSATDCWELLKEHLSRSHMATVEYFLDYVGELALQEKVTRCVALYRLLSL